MAPCGKNSSLIRLQNKEPIRPGAKTYETDRRVLIPSSVMRSRPLLRRTPPSSPSTAPSFRALLSIHGIVCALQEGGTVRAVTRMDGDADGHSDGDVQAVNSEMRRRRVAQGSHDPTRACLIRPWQDRDKLIPTNSSQGVRSAQNPLPPSGERL